MSFVTVLADSVAQAAEELEGVRSRWGAASAAAAASTTGIAAAARDEVSVAIAGLFGDYGQEFEALSAEAQAFHNDFVSALGGSATQYATAESANSAATLFESVFGPFVSNFTGGGTALGSFFGPLIAPWNTPFSYPVTAYSTPFGPIILTMNGTASGLGTINITGGSLQVPTPITLAVDAIGPVANVVGAVNNGGAAFTSAIQAGNVGAAAQAVLTTPGNAVGGFFVGQGTFTQSAPVPTSTGYQQATVSIPTGGLFAPLSPVMLTLTSTNGTVTTFPLSGAQFGGIFAGIGSAIAGGLSGA